MGSMGPGDEHGAVMDRKIFTGPSRKREPVDRNLIENLESPVRREAWYREAGIEQDYQALVQTLSRNPQDDTAAASLRALLKRTPGTFYPPKNIWRALFEHMERNLSTQGKVSKEDAADLWEYRMNAHESRLPDVPIEAFLEADPRDLPEHRVVSLTVELGDEFTEAAARQADSSLSNLQAPRHSLLGDGDILRADFESHGVEGSFEAGYFLNGSVSVEVEVQVNEGLYEDYGMEEGEEEPEDDEGIYNIAYDFLEDVTFTIAEDLSWEVGEPQVTHADRRQGNWVFVDFVADVKVPVAKKYGEDTYVFTGPTALSRFSTSRGSMTSSLVSLIRMLSTEGWKWVLDQPPHSEQQGYFARPTASGVELLTLYDEEDESTLLWLRDRLLR